MDRRQVYAWQHVQPSRTNRPGGLILFVVYRIRLTPLSTHNAMTSHPSLAHTALLVEAATLRARRPSRLPAAKSAGGSREGDTPGPIPNPAVKPLSADGTAASGRGRVGRRRLSFRSPRSDSLRDGAFVFLGTYPVRLSAQAPRAAPAVHTTQFQTGE